MSKTEEYEVKEIKQWARRKAGFSGDLHTKEARELHARGKSLVDISIRLRLPVSYIKQLIETGDVTPKFMGDKK